MAEVIKIKRYVSYEGTYRFLSLTKFSREIYSHSVVQDNNMGYTVFTTMNKGFYMRRILLFLLPFLLFTGCNDIQKKETLPLTETVKVSAEAEEDSLIYVSLGDSIARGYGLTHIYEERFSTIAGQSWKTKEAVEVYNYGVDGQTSTELITMLAEMDIPELKEADVVSISIGANNVLGPAFTFLHNYYLYLYAEPAQFDDTEIAEQFRLFTEAADAGCVVLEQDIPLLLDTLRGINPDCQILFLTLYNPYEAVNTVFQIGGMPISLAALSDTYVSLINDCIRSGTGNDQNLKIVDVYSAFSGRGKELLYAVTPDDFPPSEMNMAYMDPHPNAAGHKVIGQLTAKAYEQNTP